jgi:hypothetical protein
MGTCPNYRYAGVSKTGEEMRSFRDYLRIREAEEGIQSGGLADISAGTMEDALISMAKVAIDDYRDQFIDLMTSLSKKDERIKLDLAAYYKHKKGKMPKPQGNYVPPGGEQDDRDTVVPSSADSNWGSEPGENG